MLKVAVDRGYLCNASFSFSLLNFLNFTDSPDQSQGQGQGMLCRTKKTSWLLSVFKLAAAVEKGGKDSKGKAAKFDSRKAPTVQLAIVLLSIPILEQSHELTIDISLQGDKTDKCS